MVSKFTSFLLLLLLPSLTMGKTSTPPEKGSGNTHTIVQKDKKFSKDALTIKLGDTLVFQNDEADITHNVYSITPGNEFELKIQKPGTTTPILVDAKKHQVGEMLIECAIHPEMKLKVKIEK